jgi:nickel-dependent lactate racemase
VSCIEPQGLAGFGGGAKNVLPGISGIETLEANHASMNVEGYQAMTGIVEGNKLRADIEDIAQAVGLEATINVVTNSSRGIAGVFVGDMIKAHRTGVGFARKVFATEMIYDQDVVILNAYPKDTEFIHQMTNAFNITFLTEKEVAKNDGCVVVTSACSEGRGFHSLNDLGNRLALRQEHLLGLFKGRVGVVFSPNLTPYDVYSYFPENVHLFVRWEDAIGFIRERQEGSPKVAVFPTGPLQLPK